VTHNKIAHVYASALLDIGQERGILNALEEELGAVSRIIEEDKNILRYLNSPGISPDSKRAFFDRVFQGNISDILINLLKVLVDKGRQAIIGDIYASLRDIIDEVQNRQKVVLVSTVKLDNTILEQLRGILKNQLQKEIIFIEEIDESILGGIVLKIGDVIIDASLASDLNRFGNSLLQRKLRSESSYED